MLFVMLTYIFLTHICFTEALKKNTLTAKVNQQEAEKAVKVVHRGKRQEDKGRPECSQGQH